MLQSCLCISTQVDYGGAVVNGPNTSIAGVVRCLVSVPHPRRFDGLRLPDLRIALVDLFRMRASEGRALRAATEFTHLAYPVELASVTEKLVMACKGDARGNVLERWFLPFSWAGFDVVAMEEELDAIL
jgi:hypothetical protein